MEEGKRSSWLGMVGIFLLILGAGVGGYYLGRYLDIKALDEASNLNASVNTDVKYDSATLGISLYYSKTWTLKEVSENGISRITITSPSGSQFVYTKNVSEKADNTEYICNVDDPNGEKEENRPCTFVDGNLENNFARFQEVTLADKTVVWNIAEQGFQSSSKSYKHVPSDGFSFRSKTTTDLTEMDNIMRAVTRK